MGAFRALVLVIAAPALARCGASGAAETGRGERPISSPPGEPREPASDPPTVDALRGDTPPPVWMETRRGSAWLGHGSFCWRNTCMSAMRPECGDGHTLTVPVNAGEVVKSSLLVVGADAAVHDLRREGDVAWSDEAVTLAGTLDGGPSSSRAEACQRTRKEPRIALLCVAQ